MKELLRNILTFSLVLHTINANCNKVEKEEIFYKPENVSFAINCPVGSSIQFMEAKLYRDNCQLADALTYMKNACYLADSCATGLDHLVYDKNICPNPQKDSELRLKWFCEPKLGTTGTKSKDFCSDTASDKGYYFTFTTNTYVNEKCMCRVTVPANHEVIVQFSAFIPSGEFKDCKNHLLIGEDSSSLTKVCSKDSVSLPCQDKEKTLYFAVEKIDGGVYYNAEILVNDTSLNQLNVSCGLRAPIPVKPTTTNSFETTTKMKETTQPIIDTTVGKVQTTTKEEKTTQPIIDTTVGKVQTTTKNEKTTQPIIDTTAKINGNSVDFISDSVINTTLPPPAGSEDDDDVDNLIPIIVGICVGIAALILLITIIAVLLKYRSDTKKKSHQSMENLTTVEKFRSKSVLPPN